MTKRYSIGFLGSIHDGERKRIAEAIREMVPDALFSVSTIANSRYHLVSNHLTTKRAEYFLDRVGRAFGRF